MIKALLIDQIVCIEPDLFTVADLNEIFSLKRRLKKRNSEFTDFQKKSLKSKLMLSKQLKKK